MPAELSHEEAELKQDVVTQRRLSAASGFDNVIRLSDGDGEIRFTHRLLQRLQRVTTCEKYAFVPDGTEPQACGLTPEEREHLMKRIRQTIADAGMVQGPNQSLAEAFARALGASSRDLYDCLERRARASAMDRLQPIANLRRLRGKKKTCG